MKRYLGCAAVGLAVAAAMVACGGSHTEATQEVAPPVRVDAPPVIFNSGDRTQLPTPPAIVEPELGKFTIAGTIVGYVGSDLILKNNGEELSIAKGTETFQFTLPVTEKTSYAVSVANQPDLPTQACSVSGGSGVANATVTTVIVNCAADAKFAYLAKMSGSIERFAYDESVIRFGDSLGETQLIGLPAATNIGLAKHPYKSMVYALQTGTNQISSFLVDEKTGELRMSSMKEIPAVADADDAKINSIGARLIAHPNGKMLYSFDTAHVYAHALNDGGQPVTTTVIDGPVGVKIFEGVLNPAGTGLYVHGYLSTEMDVFPIDVATGQIGALLVPQKLYWPVSRMSFQSDGKTLFATGDQLQFAYSAADDLVLTRYEAKGYLNTGEVASDPGGKFMFVIAASTFSISANYNVSGLRQYSQDPITKLWKWVNGAASIVNPAYNLAAVDPLGKYIYLFGDEKVLGLPTGPALEGTTPADITDVKSGRALLLY